MSEPTPAFDEVVAETEEQKPQEEVVEETPENEDGVVVPDEADWPKEKDDAPRVHSEEDDEPAH